MTYHSWIDKTAELNGRAAWFILHGACQSRTVGELQAKTFPGISQSKAEQWTEYIEIERK